MRDFRDKYRFYACLLRARFDANQSEKDMVKATKMLKAGEEEFWDRQHPQPYIFPDSPGGTSYERYECYKVTAFVQSVTPKETPTTSLNDTFLMRTNIGLKSQDIFELFAGVLTDTEYF